MFDIVTLKRVDLFWENMWVGSHLVIAGVGIILINLYENRKSIIPEKASRVIHFWLIMAIQFAFGGLLSTFLVFYFRSGALVTSWPFLLILAAVFILNEVLKYHYTRLVFQTVIFFISTYAFAIFIVPVIVHSIDAQTFILSGLVSLAVIIVFIILLRIIAGERFKKSGKLIFFHIVGVTAIINILYFSNLIPPIPLSLKDAGIYHSIVRKAGGDYLAMSEHKDFWSFFAPQETFNKVGTEPVYVFSSIFSPTNLNTQIIHDWQFYDELNKSWRSLNKINLSIVGGRDGGFRTYSIKTVNTPGLWRVDVKTLQGQLIGRIKFKVENASTTPQLFETVLN